MAWDQEVPLYYDDMILPLILCTQSDPKVEAMKTGISNISFTPSSNDVIISRENEKSEGNKKLKNPTKVKDLICLSCGYKGKNKRGLLLHKRQKHGLKSYTCPYCELTLHHKELVHHISRNHANEKRYMCPHCDYGSPLKRYLKMHLAKKHLQVQEFQCNECNYSTDTSEKLQRHLDTHSTESVPSRRCIFCLFGTENLRDLKHHIKVVHENKKEFSCQHCDFKTTHFQSLKKHLASRHSKEQFFECSYCQYIASRSENLSHHILKKHKVSSDAEVCITLETSDEDSHPTLKSESHGGNQSVILDGLPVIKTKKKMGKRENKGLKNDKNKSVVKSKSVGIKISKNQVNRQMQAEPLFKSYREEPTVLRSNTESLTSSGLNNSENKAQFKAVYTIQDSYDCPSCDFSTAYPKSFARHIAEKHKKDGVCHCPICSYSTYHQDFFQHHILKHFTRKGKWKRKEKFEYCNSSSSNVPINLGKQVENNLPHSESKQTLETYPNQSSLFSNAKRSHLQLQSQIHIKQHASPKEEMKTTVKKIKHKQKKKKQIQCSGCEFIAGGNRELNIHTKTVHENLPQYTCPFCNFKNVHLASMNIHIMGQHTQERPYSCGKCSFTSVQPSQLKHHNKIKHSRNQRPAQSVLTV